MAVGKSFNMGHERPIVRIITNSDRNRQDEVQKGATYRCLNTHAVNRSAGLTSDCINIVPPSSYKHRDYSLVDLL